MDPQIADIVRRYRRNLDALGIKTSRIIVYGSYASGEARDDSDLDLLVVSDDLKDLDLWERLTLLGRARVGIYHPMDIEGATEAECQQATSNTFLKGEILQKGIPFLTRAPSHHYIKEASGRRR